MRLCQISVRALMVTACAILFASFAQGQAAAPSATVSPLVLNFGVPGTVTGTPSAVQQVTVAISNGSLPVSFSFSGQNAGDFGETDTCGTIPAGSKTIAAPGCVINVTFTPTSPAGTKEVATLTVNAGGSSTVNLTGSLGSILLFKSVNVGPSNGGATLQNLVTFNNTTLALSCPAGSTASLSSSPDGSGNVLVDNFITVRMGANLPLQTDSGSLVGNVCPANQGNPQDNGQADCFTSAYQGPAGNNKLNGVNPDTITNAGNTNPQLNGAAGGVPPIPLTGLTSATMPTNPTTTISMLDGGGFVASSSLFLVTQCVPNGVASGDTVTGNPTNPNDPSTLNQSFIFDSVNGQNSQFTSNTASNPDVAPAGTQQIIQVFPIPQQLFNQLVSGTSAAPSVCVRLNSVIDPFNKTMCEGFLIQCWDATHSTLSGDNCTPNPAAARNLFDFTGYDSTDAPPGQNYLANVESSDGTIVSACSGVAPQCAQNVIGTGASSTMLVGPGLLLGGDQWLCPPNSNLTTCQSQANLTTQSMGTKYTTANCVLTGSLAGDPCPMNPLTQFKGAADPTHGITTSGKNSIFVPVVNVPLPFTQTTVSGRNQNGWTQTPGPTATFISNEANYLPQSGNPVGNTFVASPPYSVTYGIASANSPAPDTTFAVANDVTAYNGNNVSQSFGTPLCGTNPAPPPSFTTTSAAFTSAVTGGIYDLHYFTTDCALSEELLFQPTNSQLTDATANWASFRTIAFGVDSTPPTLSCPAPTPGPGATNGWFLTPPTVTCTASDDNNGTLAGIASGFAPGSQATNNGCNSAISSDCIVLVGNPDPKPTVVNVTGSGASAYIPQQTVTDLAGNVSNIQGPYNTPIDNTAPTITAKYSVSGTTFTLGQTVTATFTCMDTGSGLTTCGTQTVATCQAAPTVNASNFTSPKVTIDTTSATALGTHMLYAVDCAGNPSSPVAYTVVLGSAELLIANVPNPLASVKSGSNLTYNIFVLNLSANTASNVVVTDTLPAGAQIVSTMANIGSCTASGCGQITSGSSCSVSGSVVTCSTPTLKPLLPGLTGFVIKIVVKVTEPSTVKSISDTATVTSANPDPIKLDNSVTVTTKVTQ